jgi:hypothetical protein
MSERSSTSHGDKAEDAAKTTTGQSVPGSKAAEGGPGKGRRVADKVAHGEKDEATDRTGRAR